MKFRVTMKTPDALDRAISEATDDVCEAGHIAEMCERWFKYGEYLTVEIDTEAKTCVVV